MFQLAVCKSFFESLIELNHETQKKAIQFIKKISFEVKRKGINLEAVEGARDKRMRSARIDQNHRAILVQSQSKKEAILYLVWAAAHDDAYLWARAKIFPDDELDLAMPISSIMPQSFSSKGMFESVTQEDLLALGLPYFFLQWISIIERDDQLDEMRPFLPLALYNDLFSLAAGDRIDDILARRMKEKKEFEDYQYQLYEKEELAPKAKSFKEPLISGQLVGKKYIIEKLVGIDPAEQKSAVYKVHDIDNPYSQAGAIKVFYSQDSRVNQIIENELSIRQCIVHENISRCFGADKIEESGERFLILEYHEGMTLANWVKASTPDVALKRTMLEYAYQILSGLKRLHEEAFVHGKISPHHIVIDANNKVKIVSFDNSGRPGFDRPLSLALPRYAPPDFQEIGWHFGQDTYAVGVILYEILFEENLDRENPNINNEKRDLIGYKLAKFIIRACAPKEKDRFLNAGEMLAELQEFVRKH